VVNKDVMGLKEPILKILRKKYDCVSLIACSCNQYELSFKTDESGDPLQAFLERKTSKGNVKGQGYIRCMIHDASGRLNKDYWLPRNEFNRFII